MAYEIGFDQFLVQELFGQANGTFIFRLKRDHEPLMLRDSAQSFDKAPEKDQHKVTVIACAEEIVDYDLGSEGEDQEQSRKATLGIEGKKAQIVLKTGFFKTQKRVTVFG